ncbi:MAG TPA: GNAT family N-acetyltransferase [Vicinamibacterales bacterium]|nr:GNAT family N-acetyltransferase [Vicinamibacterales bacterium]
MGPGRNRGLVVRPLRPGEARRYLEIQRTAVRGIAASDYPDDVIEAWAPLPIAEGDVSAIEGDETEIRLIAELNGQPAGMGAFVPEHSELRACYVTPGAARRGVGRALVNEIERRARAAGLAELRLVSSLTAERFYAVLGYEVVRRTEHVLRSGVRMSAVEMRKNLQT